MKHCLSTPLLLSLLAGSLVLFPGWTASQAQDDQGKRESYIQITGGSAARLPLALPSFKLGNGGIEESSQFLRSVVRRDLTLSGYFDVMDDMAYIEAASAGISPGTFKFEDWQAPGAVGLVKASVGMSNGGFLVEVHCFDVDASFQILQQSVEGQDPRRVAHLISNAIVEAFTGQPGIFDSRIVAVADLGGGKEIYTFDYDGENRRSISRNGSINLSPAWSPDGTRISYTSYRDNNPDLWVTDLRTGRHTKLSHRPGINAGAEWSPNGAEIALTLSKDQDSEIYAITPEGVIAERLTRNWGIDVSPTYSPDGNLIAFVSSRNGTPQIFVMNRDGTSPRRLTEMGGHNVSPAFSPDGSQVAFAGRDGGRFDVFVINIDGSGLRRLTQSRGDDEDPTWSPDGNHNVFSSSRDGRGKQLYIMTADGRSQARLTNGSGSFSNPMWGPTSR
ncbi:MAG: Tol-Pal system beta propeller repeat protein TolB [Myxococcota bacterium]|nr:Tol-Pal system beta propeller repeat protein TolB [Myxococcota bacterium]